MSNIRYMIGLVLVLVMFSGCEDKGYGTQDISVVPSVTVSDKVSLVDSIPVNGGVVAQRAYINVAFSSYIDKSSVTGSSVYLQKGNIEVATEFLVLRNYVFIKPLESLEVNQTYTLNINGLKDIFDNSLADNYTLNFTCQSDFWVSTRAGVSNSMAQSKAGDLYIWGSNAPLPIGVGEEAIEFISIDMPIPIPKTQKAKSFDVGPNTMAMISERGTLTEIGVNAYSDLDDTSYLEVATGSSHTVVLKEDGTVFSWGSNSNGQLGASLVLNSKSEPIQEYTKDTNWTAISAGADFTIALKKDGTIWGWGDNTFGQIGRRFDTIPFPFELNASGTSISSVLQISAGGTHTLALDDNHKLWAWGKNEQGELGDGANALSRIGTEVLGDVNWSFVSAGFDHTVATDENATLWAWGNNGSGQLGNGSTDDSNIPVRETNTTRLWKHVSAGKDYTLGVTTDGRLWAWGTNTYRRLGLDENITATEVPLEVK